MGKVIKEEINDFFWNKSDRGNRFRIFNFLYDKTDGKHEENGFSYITKKEATKKIEELEGKLKTVNDALQAELSTQKEEQESFLEKLKNSVKKSGKDKIKKEWLDIVEEIHYYYNNYLEQMKDKEINYLIISEAPKLTIKKNEDKLHCSYIFDETNDKVGFYRDEPYNALGGEKTDPTACDLINLYVEKGVAFLDLAPIPLPELTTDLRYKWGFDQDYNVEGRPRSIIFLEIAFEKFLKETNAKFNKNTKVALMMPPKTASGIIDFFMNIKNRTNCQELNELRLQFIQENNNENIVKYKIPHTAWKLHKAICTNGANTPQETMIRNALDLLPKS
ncbi:MAG: hypothetical protein FJX80_12075 [Bacteroidetes bacterium]|nr:hypothetical protein [Bacteroidota bacterium]